MLVRIMGAAALAATLASPVAAEVSNAARRESQAVPGLQQPAEILVDRWGVPHIYAKSTRDAFFLQGWNAARDRLWQIDLWRKRGLGRLSASFGPAYIEQDRAARLFLYRGDMAAEWAAYDPIGREAVEAFAAGVNAYVAQVSAGERPLPVEFRLTDSKPEAWAPEDILRIRSHALVSNAASEAARARTVCKAGLAADAVRRRLEPEHTPAIPKGLDPCDVPDDVMKDYTLGTGSVSFAPLAKQKAAEAPGAVALSQFLQDQAAEGSNNWVIAGSRTASGRPILANDPHRPVGAPSLRYIAHLDAPGLSLIGAGEPALPGVSLGHNGKAAFGLTIFYIDQEDLYVYETRGDAYRYKGGWEPMRIVRETIEVKGEAPRQVELRFTRHGPVLKSDTPKARAFALRTVWNEPGLAGYFGSSRMWRAGSWAEFQTARNRWGAPPLNLVYADDTGETGWAAAGRTPVRRNWDGLMPVPGDGRYEWAGFLGDDKLPVVRNPAAGFFATANEMNVPAEPDYPRAARRLGFEWTDPSRAVRIKEVLAATPKGTLADSMALQTDAVSAQARRAQALLAPLSSDDAEVARALSLLKAWDGNEGTDSVAASIYETWVVKHLGRAVVRKATPATVQAQIGASMPDPVLLWLERQPREVRDPLLLSSLRTTLDELKARLGADMTAWAWGRLHQALFEPAAAVLADPQLAAQMRIGPLQVAGSSSTPRAATWRSPDFRQTAGASVRLVLDVGGWDNSMAINTPGQSEDPFSPHYRDLFPLWAAGGYFPLRYTRPAVEADTEAVLALTPG
ncbi:penicillin acylase family protein [Phenylobacterium sp.]|jgi:penicillin amidase|uniref:penicillin acylase family protein n=1 Tax=Phenylobacterium sp. TaxID=1871053 RepID=UPI0037842178